VAVALSAPVVWFNSLSVLVAIVPAMTVDNTGRNPRRSDPPRA
jgi:hypothetical protein